MSPERRGRTRTLVIVAGIILLAGSYAFVELAQALRDESRKNAVLNNPRVQISGNVYNWWDSIPDEIQAGSVTSAGHDNISPGSYAGPESCQKCHRRNFDAWSKHPHRWMNAVASDDTVKGDFSDSAGISYLGGTARFFRHGDEYRMTLQRDGLRRKYTITQTIGSRFYQYYVGKGLSGPEPPDHDYYRVDHVLPFGYWLDRREWVPTVHVHWVAMGRDQVDEEDVPSDERPDPFAARGESIGFTPYYLCSQCHSTYPLGDLLMRNPDVVGRHAPRMLNLSVPAYLGSAHPSLWKADRPSWELDDESRKELLQQIQSWEAPEYASSFGITCEACHLGCREHAEGRQKSPPFAPQSRHLFVQSDNATLDLSRTHENVNWVCGRCHAGSRRLLAGGMATWNSTEYTDALRGSCYSQLTCVACHNPHEATGATWSKPLAELDQVCLKCHAEFASAERLQAHTHHAATSEGSRCVSCHMPRLNEGMQDVVRTHMIFSPTEPKMLSARQPNACNLCHPEKSEKWASGLMADWYRADLSVPDETSDEPAGLSWLRHSDQSVRLIGSDALSRTKARWALPELINVLDDPFLLNRQFARTSIERLLEIELSRFGYHYYMTAEERAAPLAQIRKALIPNLDRATVVPGEVKP